MMRKSQHGGSFILLDDSLSKRIRSRGWAETTLLIALAAFLLVKGILPALRELNTDFPNYYLVARLVREGYSLDRVYDWIWLQRVKDHWGLMQALVGFAGLTPCSALPLVPLTVFSAMTAKRIWIALNLIFLAGSAELLHRSTSIGRRRVWVLCLLACTPLRANFLYGQMHLLVLLFMVIAYVCYRKDKLTACGASIALAAALKVYPVFFAFYFLWKKQWRALFGLLGVAALVALLTSAWMGPALLQQYISQELPRSLQGEMLDPYHWHAASMSALLHRLLLVEPALNPKPLFNSPGLYAVLYPLWQLAILVPFFALIRTTRASSERSDALEWAALTMALLVLSPVPSSYHFVVMILPIVLLVDVLRYKPRWVAIVVTLYGLISATTLWIPSRPSPLYIALVGFSRLWIGMVLYALCLRTLRMEHSHTPISSQRVRVLAAAAASVLLTGILGYRHHFAFRDLQMSRRILPAPPSYLATAPRTISDGQLFVGMTPQGYRVLNQNERLPLDGVSQDEDQLSFDASPDLHTLYVESASIRESQIIRANDHRVLAEDAESPAISRDRSSLLFLREDKGRGSVWAVNLENGDVTTDAPRRLTDDTYDVRSATWFTGREVIFAAKNAGHFGIFLSTTKGVIPVFTPPDDIGALSLSPDSSRIAFTQLIHSRWQLLVMDLRSQQQHPLTAGDCNAYTPTWRDSSTVVYATDCGRGLGLTALAQTPTE